MPKGSPSAEIILWRGSENYGDFVPNPWYQKGLETPIYIKKLLGRNWEKSILQRVLRIPVLNGEITWKGRKIHDYLNNVALYDLKEKRIWKARKTTIQLVLNP